MSEMELRAQMLQQQTQLGEVQLAQRLEQLERLTRQREMDLTMRLVQIEQRVVRVMTELDEQRKQDQYRMEEMGHEHEERMLLMEKQQRAAATRVGDARFGYGVVLR